MVKSDSTIIYQGSYYYIMGMLEITWNEKWNKWFWRTYKDGGIVMYNKWRQNESFAIVIRELLEKLAGVRVAGCDE